MLLEVSTLIRCGMACSYCPRVVEEKYQGPKFMTLELFEKALERSPKDIPVSFAGYAEPYLNNKCSKMIEHTVAKGHELWVYTTGVGMKDSDVDILINIQPTRLVLHLPDGDGDMKFKVTPEFVKRIDRLATHVKNFSAGCYGSMHPLLAHYEPYVRKSGWGLISRAGSVVHLPQVNKRGPLRCGISADLTNNMLLPNGDLACCCCDWSLEYILGNILTETWEAIHSGAVITKMRMAMASQNDKVLCRQCEFAQPC